MRILALIALAAFLAGTATAQDSKTPKPPDLALEAYTLPNGLKVALHRDSVVPRVTVSVAYHVGSKNEKAGRTGFAHFFEHMMFRGTKNVPNYDIPLQEAGASSNAFTNQDMTVYFETVPSNFLERGALISRPSGWRFCRPPSIRKNLTPSATWSRTSDARAMKTGRMDSTPRRFSRLSFRRDIPTPGQRSGRWMI